MIMQTNVIFFRHKTAKLDYEVNKLLQAVPEQ